MSDSSEITRAETVPDSEIARLIHAFDSAKTPEELARWGRAFIEPHGIVMSTYHHRPPAGASDYDPQILKVFDQGFPDDWSEQYFNEKLREDDPIPRVALHTASPVKWFEVAQHAPLSDREKAFLARMKAAGFGDGITLPVYGPNGRNGVFGFGYGEAGCDLSLYALNQLHWACQLGHIRYCNLLENSLGGTVSLSPREGEILQWVARGKSNAVIADIIGISAYTVDTHMRRIYLKLGVTDRVTAALRGLATGLIS